MPELIPRIARSAGCRVPLLDNTCNPLAVPDDSAVARTDPRRPRSRPWRAAPVDVVIDQRFQSVSADSSGTSPDSSTTRSGRSAKRPARPSAGRGRAELWLLDHKRETRLARERRLSCFGLMADDDGRSSAARGPRRAASTWSIIGRPATRCSTFGQRGFHPRALAGGQDDDVEIGHRTSGLIELIAAAA